MRCARLNDNQIVAPTKAKAPTANELFLHKERGARGSVRARRVAVHPPTLLICSPLGRLPNVEGARPILFSASKANERAGTP